MKRNLTIAVALTALIVAGLLILYSHFLNIRANLILRAAYELSEKQSPTVLDVQAQFGRILRLENCSASDCGYSVTVSNRILAMLRLTPYTEMKSHFWVRDGAVLMNMLDYSTTVQRHKSIVAHVQIDFCKGCQAVDVHPWDAASSLDTNGLLGIGSEATAHSRRTILSINTDCLTRLGGCQTIADLLPAVWKRTADGKIACAIQNDRGFVEKPANWP